MATATEKETRPLLRTIEGVVASDKGNKTIKVVVEFQTKHAKYGKYMKRRTVLHAHDEKNDAKEGDRVEIAECRPLRSASTSARNSLPIRGARSIRNKPGSAVCLALVTMKPSVGESGSRGCLDRALLPKS